MIDQEQVKIALKQMDTSKGIKISDLVIALGHRPSKETNNLTSKILLTMNWERSNTRKRAGNNSLYYLWLAPTITTTSIEVAELNQLKNYNWSKDSKIMKLEEQVAELKQQRQQLMERLDSYIFGSHSCREQAEIEENRILRSATPEPVSVPQTVSPLPPATITSPALSAISQSQLDKLMSQFKPRFREPLAYILQNWTQTQDKRGMRVKVDFRLVPNAPATSVINQTCSEMFGKGWLKADGSSWWIVSGDLLEVLEDIDTDDQTDTEDLEMMENMAG